MLSDDSKFKKTGEPVFLPGSMGDSTYLCVSNSGNSRTFFSAGHGSGRRRASDIAPKAARIEDLKKKLLTRRVRLYKGLSRSIVDQDPDCFKDIEATLRAYTENGLLKAVLKTRPVAVLKG
jgi:tRNA-splicing ligase RtcB